MIDSNFPEKVRTTLTSNYPQVHEYETEISSFNLTDDFRDEFLSRSIANNLIVDLGLETEPGEDIIIRTSESRAAYLSETINDLTDLFTENAGENSEELDFIRLEFDHIVDPLIAESGELFTLYVD
mgnify:FL=1